MMPEHLLSELEQTATEHGVKTALIMAFQHGKLESYREFMQDVAKRTQGVSQ